MKKLTQWREAVLTEVDLSPVGENGNIIAGSKVNSEPKLFYPRKVRKEMVDIPLSVDLIYGYVQSAVATLNQGKEVRPNSADHHALRELLQKLSE
jgi:hypothetical protein